MTPSLDAVTPTAEPDSTAADSAAARPGEPPVLELTDVTKRYGDVVALDRVSLAVPAGELLAVVGPSGCGKSTLLRAVAGLVPIDGGRIAAGGRDVAGPGTWVPPERRQVGVVFQDMALFPHLDVAGNVGFGIPAPRGRDAGRSARVADVLDLVGLGPLAGRYPHELSGGEQQRVALARALAPGPAVVLLDEPFSHLDRSLRVHVRSETVAVLRAAGATGVLVTHDQEEALAVGDRVAVLDAGRLEQVAGPEEVFHSPASRFVATFVGEADFLAGERTGDVAATAVGPVPVLRGEGPGPVDVVLRPHELEMERADRGEAEVVRTEFRGATVLHHVRLEDGTSLRVQRPHTRAEAVGTRVTVRAVPGHPLAAFPR